MNAKIDANSAQIVKLAVAQVEYGRVMGKIEGGLETLSSRVGKIEGGVEELSSRMARLETRQDKQQLAIEDLKAGQDKQQATLERMERILMETVKRLSVQEVR
ncbi:MAG: hypothetical protein OXU25_07815, partial [Thaumarchaeota archaeon]|nr:hypothetical protein [Nitrososphaerota archaeon]